MDINIQLEKKIMNETDAEKKHRVLLNFALLNKQITILDEVVVFL